MAWPLRISIAIFLLAVSVTGVTAVLLMPVDPAVEGARTTATPPLKLKSLGVNLGTYNAKTNRAGDFRFTPAKVELGIIFVEFGRVIPGNSATGGKVKVSPQVEFRLPMGTPVRSLVDGVVVSVPKLYSGDYSIMVSDGKDSNWLYETEHVSKPLVKAGDRVKAGQVIAQVSPHSASNYDGLGLVEIGILNGGSSGPQHVCPFAYLDSAIKDDVLAKVKAFYTSWEKYRGSTSIYNEKATAIPGCDTLNAVAG